MSEITGVENKEFRKALFPALREEDIFVRLLDGDNTGADVYLYMKGDAVSIYFDEVFGPMGWKKENQIIYAPNGNATFMCTLTATLNGVTTSKDGVGEDGNYGDSIEKSKETDALKRAAYQFGLGRELKHHYPRIHFPIEKLSEYNQSGSSAAGAKFTFNDELVVEQIVYADKETIDRRIVKLSILNKSTNQRVIFDIEQELKETREKLAKAEAKREIGKKPSTRATKTSTKKSSDVNIDYSSFVIDLPGQLNGKKLSEVHPQQVVWIYENVQSSSDLKDACVGYAKSTAPVGELFAQNGII